MASFTQSQQRASTLEGRIFKHRSYDHIIAMVIRDPNRTDSWLLINLLIGRTEHDSMSDDAIHRQLQNWVELEESPTIQKHVDTARYRRVFNIPINHPDDTHVHVHHNEVTVGCQRFSHTQAEQVKAAMDNYR